MIVYVAMQVYYSICRYCKVNLKRVIKIFNKLKYKLWLHLNKEFIKPKLKYKCKIQRPKIINITKGCCDICLKPKQMYLYFGKKEVGLCKDCFVEFHKGFNEDYDEWIKDINNKESNR